MHATTFANLGSAQGIGPLLRLLLTSDGTLVDHLAAFYGKPVHLEQVCQREVILDDVTADRLGVATGEKGLERFARLRVGDPGEIVVVASSFFPRATLTPGLSRAMQAGRLPLGKLIQHLLVRRDRLEIARLPVPEMAQALGRPETECFWTRRYRLTLSDGGVGVIFETFAPALAAL